MKSAVTPSSLREQKKHHVRRRIAEAAMRLAVEKGIEQVSPEEIAAQAEVGRATLFRYFGSKEAAIITGFYEQRLTALVHTLAAAPQNLGPLDAVIWAFRKLGGSAEPELKVLRLHVRMVSASTTLRAQALEFHSRYESAIASAISWRFAKKRTKDLRPQLLAAAVLAVTQTSVEHWAAQRETANLADLVIGALEQLNSGFKDPE